MDLDMVRLQKVTIMKKKKTIQSLLYVCIPEPLTLASDGHQVSCKCAGWAFWGVSVSSLWRECMWSFSELYC